MGNDGHGERNRIARQAPQDATAETSWLGHRRGVLVHPWAPAPPADSRRGAGCGATSWQTEHRHCAEARRYASAACRHRGDRKSGVWGKSVAVRVDLGGRRIIKKKTNTQTPRRQTQTK